jgi:predicted NAD-dependent protein-ADP-ribosyltransferase YbiA (DUF1768 family)
MKTIVRATRLVLVPETLEEAEQLTVWKAAAIGQALSLDANTGDGLSIKQLGKTEEICREPINVTSRHADEAIRLIGNLADTPFELDGLSYRSVESFWQGLKVVDSEARRRIAMYPGPRCKSDRSIPGYGATLEYNGETVVVGTWDHWQLMQRACLAKFQQHIGAQRALIATGPRPLVHRVRRDSRVIPGVIMAEIWMGIRKRLTG